MLWLTVLPVLALLWLFLIWPNLPARPLGDLAGHDYAHRGLWDETHPENSLSAFRRAAERGLGIELDVQLTADRQLVVFHDSDLSRMCGIRRQLSACTLRELQACRLLGTDETIPTLAEVLREVDGRSPLIVELKLPGRSRRWRENPFRTDGKKKVRSTRRVTALCELTERTLRGFRSPWCVESFDPRAVRWWRKHRPDVLRGQLAFGLTRRRLHPFWRNLALGGLLVNFLGRPDFLALEAATEGGPSMALVRRLRPSLVAWTCRSPEEMAGLKTRYDLVIFEGFLPEGAGDTAS